VIGKWLPTCWYMKSSRLKMLLFSICNKDSRKV
jgi:hypothetical protein